MTENCNVKDITYCKCFTLLVQSHTFSSVQESIVLRSRIRERCHFVRSNELSRGNHLLYCTGCTGCTVARAGGSCRQRPFEAPDLAKRLRSHVLHWSGVHDTATVKIACFPVWIAGRSAGVGVRSGALTATVAAMLQIDISSHTVAPWRAYHFLRLLLGA